MYPPPMEVTDFIGLILDQHDQTYRLSVTFTAAILFAQKREDQQMPFTASKFFLAFR